MNKYLDPFTKNIVLFEPEDKFSIFVRRSTGPRKLYAEYDSKSLVSAISSFHELNIPKGYRKYLVQSTPESTEIELYKIKGYGDPSIVSPPRVVAPMKNIFGQGVHANIRISYLPAPISMALKSINPGEYSLPEKACHSTLIKLLLAGFLSLGTEERKQLLGLYRDRMDKMLGVE